VNPLGGYKANRPRKRMVERVVEWSPTSGGAGASDRKSPPRAVFDVPETRFACEPFGASGRNVNPSPREQRAGNFGNEVASNGPGHGARPGGPAGRPALEGQLSIAGRDARTGREGGRCTATRVTARLVTTPHRWWHAGAIPRLSTVAVHGGKASKGRNAFRGIPRGR